MSNKIARNTLTRVKRVSALIYNFKLLTYPCSKSTLLNTFLNNYYDDFKLQNMFLRLFKTLNRIFANLINTDSFTKFEKGKTKTFI